MTELHLPAVPTKPAHYEAVIVHGGIAYVLDKCRGLTIDAIRHSNNPN